MDGIQLTLSTVGGFPYLKLEGELNLNNFTALHLVTKGATKFGTVPVIADLSGELHIAEDVKQTRCWRAEGEVPAFATSVILLIISSERTINDIRALLVPHELQHAHSLDDALEMLSKTPSS